jgi:hypothetical protein
MNQILNNSFFKLLATSFLLAYATGKGMAYGGYDFDPFYSVLIFFVRVLWVYTLVEMAIGKIRLKKFGLYLLKLVKG